MLRRWHLLMLLSGLLPLLASCRDSGTEPPRPSNNLAVLVPANYHALVLQMVDYDVARITHQAALVLATPTVRRIEIGTKAEGTFHQIAAFESTYDSVQKANLIHFDFVVRLDSSKIVHPLTIRYRSVDSTSADVDTSIALYKFPYPSAMIFADSGIVGPFYQDIARSQTKLFFHGWSDGLHEYDLVTHERRYLYEYTLGTEISAESSYVFCDIDHNKVVRFNLLTNAPDIIFTNLDNVLIDGIAAYNSYVYVMVANGPVEKVKVFTLSGVLRDSIICPEQSHFMAIADSVIYSKGYTGSGPRPEMKRFDLRTMRFLPKVHSPARFLFGNEIFRDTLYYCDAVKGFVGALPVTDLVPVE